MGMRMAGIPADPGKVHHDPSFLPWGKHQLLVWRTTADPRAHHQGMYPPENQWKHCAFNISGGKLMPKAMPTFPDEPEPPDID